MARRRSFHRRVVVTAGLAALGLGLTGIGMGVPAGAAGAADANTPVVHMLQRLIQFDTSDPPGHTEALDRFLQAKFAGHGFQTYIVQTPQKGVTYFIAELKGSTDAKPLLIQAHADVVPVNRTTWTVPPFEGVIKNNYVYGRGAMDNKGNLAIDAQAMLRLAENHVTPKRTIIFMSEADEETGNYGTSWLAKQPKWWNIVGHPAAALNEGGWILEGSDGKARQVNITTRDKIYSTLILSTSGVSTHSSRPISPFTGGEYGAVSRLALGLGKLAHYQPPVVLDQQTRQYFATLAKSGGTLATKDKSQFASYLRTLATSHDQATLDKVGRRVVLDSAYPPLFNALMRNTIAPTILQAGLKENVIPTNAQATVNTRLIPGGSTPYTVIPQLKSVINDPKVHISLENLTHSSAAQLRASYEKSAREQPSPTDTPLYQALVAQSKAEWPTTQVGSALFEAGTDATPWRDEGVPVYGFYAYPLDNQTLQAMHGNDERISVQSINQGEDMVYKTLVQAGTTTVGAPAQAILPSGAPATGGGSTSGVENLDLIVLGGLVLTAGGAMLVRRKLIRR